MAQEPVSERGGTAFHMRSTSEGQEIQTVPFVRLREFKGTYAHATDLACARFLIISLPKFKGFPAPHYGYLQLQNFTKGSVPCQSTGNDAARKRNLPRHNYCN